MTTKTKQLGRTPKKDPAIYRYMIRFTASENAKFLSLFDASGMKVKAHFISACVLEKPIKVVKVNKAAMDYYMRLTNIQSEFRAIGVNYNQVTRSIKSTFTEKKALAFLFKLEKATINLVEIGRQVIELTAEFEQKYLSK